MAVWSITCGYCGNKVGAEATQPRNPSDGGVWLQCPVCTKLSVSDLYGRQFPQQLPGRAVDNLPTDLDRAWLEARRSFATGAFTAAEIMCRKILMHLAVDVASAHPGKSFVEYVDVLNEAGYITTGLRSVVDQVRARGNVANHDLPASTEQQAAQTISIVEYLLHSIYELPALAGPATAPRSAQPPVEDQMYGGLDGKPV